MEGQPKKKDENEGEPKSKPRSQRTATDVQKAKLDKLMKNPEKPVHIPTHRPPKDPNRAPEFVYNVMGSSAGAGSGEFHVYRQIRRKEFTRMKVLDGEREQDLKDQEFHKKLEENKKKDEERTAKKRQKRMKKKEAAKKRKEEAKKAKQDKSKESSSSSESSEEEN